MTETETRLLWQVTDTRTDEVIADSFVSPEAEEALTEFATDGGFPPDVLVIEAMGCESCGCQASRLLPTGRGGVALCWACPGSAARRIAARRPEPDRAGIFARFDAARAESKARIAREAALRDALR